MVSSSQNTPQSTSDGHIDNDIDKQAVATVNAPKAAAAYSQAIIANGMIFTAGQIGLDPASGELVADEIGVQTRRVLDNLVAVLKDAGSSLDHVVKVNVYLSDMSEFAAMNAVYAEYFNAATLTSPLPARTTIQAVLPRNARVEIDMIALKGSP